MLDTNSSSTCALVAGVSGAGWRNLGLKISASRVPQLEGRVRFILSEAPTPLKVVNGIRALELKCSCCALVVFLLP